MSLDERLAALGGDIAQDVAVLRDILTRATAIADLYALTTTPEERKELLAHIFRRIEVTNRTVTRIEYNPPYHLLLGRTGNRAGSGRVVQEELLNYAGTQRQYRPQGL